MSIQTPGVRVFQLVATQTESLNMIDISCFSISILSFQQRCDVINSVGYTADLHNITAICFLPRWYKTAFHCTAILRIVHAGQVLQNLVKRNCNHLYLQLRATHVKADRHRTRFGNAARFFIFPKQINRSTIENFGRYQK